jgi:hypothetical protein
MIDRLRALLGPKPNNPWAALLPQLLLWCFRRFCVEKLLTLGDALLLEQVWDDHFDLVRNYAPRGLQNVGNTWLLPDHLDTMHSTAEDFNQFFLDVLEAIDIALAEEDEAAQGRLSDLLDGGFREVVVDWLEEPENPLLIYPLSAEDDDAFPDMRLVGLIRMIMDTLEGEDAASDTSSESGVVEDDQGGSDEEEEPEPEPPTPPENPLPPTPAATAMATAAARRRHTYRRHGRRANRGSTLRIKRIRRQTRGRRRRAPYSSSESETGSPANNSTQLTVTFKDVPPESL